jgi:hypothetical protein
MLLLIQLCNQDGIYSRRDLRGFGNLGGLLNVNLAATWNY